MKDSNWLPLLCLVVILMVVGPTFAQDHLAWEGREVELLPIPNSNRWLHVEQDNQEYLAVLSPSRLFRVLQPEPVIVRKVRKRGGDVEFVLVNEHLGKGKIRFLDVAHWPESVRNEMTTLILHVPGRSIPLRFIAHRQAHVVHFLGSNHLPPLEEQEAFPSAEKAQDAGYRLCNLCFSRRPAISGYELERRLGLVAAADLRSQNPILGDFVAQQRVRRVGEEVVHRWPFPLKGYNYSFTVIDSEAPNAFAVPGGQIFISAGLLRGLETDEELMSILAHEIAHVEMRHGYREFLAAQKASIWAGLASVLVGVTTKSPEVTELVARLTNFVRALVLNGYSRKHEDEADSLAAIFLEINEIKSGRWAFANVLSKLLYGLELSGINPRKKGGWFSTHPDLPDRIAKVRNSQSHIIRDGTFEGFNTEDEVVARINFFLQRYYPRRRGAPAGFEVLVLIESTSALEEKAKIKKMVLQTEIGKIKLDNKEDTEIQPGGSVGAILVNRKHSAFFEQINDVKLKLRNVRQWRRVQAKSAER